MSNCFETRFIERKKPLYTEHKDHDCRISSAKKAIEGILSLDLYPAHKRRLLRQVIWEITEADGKYNVRYWSEGAVAGNEEKLQHEHVHEIKELIARLLNGESIESVVSDALACLVTKEEHRRLTNSGKNGWARYADAGIRVFDARLGQWR